MRPVVRVVGWTRERRWSDTALRASAYVLAVVAWMSAVTAARAGHYVRSGTTGYSGGRVYPPPPATPRDYSLVSGNWAGGYAAGNGTVTCRDLITASFDWVADWSGEPPPATVIVKETCTASWSAAGFQTPSGNCSNDMGNGELPLGPLPGWPNPPFITASGRSTGTRYSVVAGIPHLEFHCNPRAAATGMPLAQAGVAYSRDVAPVVCNLAGVTTDPDTHSRDIMIGQGCTGTLSAGSYTLRSFNWSITGDTFKLYEAHGLASGGWAQTCFLSSADLRAADPHWFWRYEGGGGHSPQTVFGQADAYDGGQYIGTVNGYANLTVWAPTYLCSHNARNVTLDVDASGNVFIGAGSWTEDGIDWYGQCQPPDPPQLFVRKGQGKWSFVQEVYGERSYTDAGTVLRDPFNGLAGLDDSYPYAPPQSTMENDDSNAGWWDDWLEQTAGDRPAKLNVADSVSNVNFADRFWTVMMYRPPDVGNGNQWVPLHEIRWQWSVDVSRPGLSWVTAPPPYTSVLGSVAVTLDERWPYHPEWSLVILSPPFVP